MKKAEKSRFLNFIMWKKLRFNEAKNIVRKSDLILNISIKKKEILLLILYKIRDEIRIKLIVIFAK